MKYLEHMKYLKLFEDFKDDEFDDEISLLLPVWNQTSIAKTKEEQILIDSENIEEIDFIEVPIKKNFYRSSNTGPR